MMATKYLLEREVNSTCAWCGIMCETSEIIAIQACNSFGLAVCHHCFSVQGHHCYHESCYLRECSIDDTEDRCYSSVHADGKRREIELKTVELEMP